MISNSIAESLQSAAHLIDGALVPSDKKFGITNPATGEVFALCPDASRDQFDTAVAAARRAFLAWKNTSFDYRRELLTRFADAIQKNIPEIAPILTAEQGKPLGAARAEIEMAVGVMRQLISLQVAPEILRNDASGRVELHYAPLGVVGAITPWNVPILLAIPKITSALYTGNAMVLKPSPYTPFSTLTLGYIARDIFPAGVLNIVAGGNDLGQWITEHPGIDKITFTGSVGTGKRVMQSASVNMKRLTLELGGNDAAIVLDDVDPQKIAARLFMASFANSGQVCQAIKRLYVHEKIYEPLLLELARIAKNAKLGDGMEPGVTMGPVQNKAQFDHVLALIADAQLRPGVRIVAGGRKLNRPGYFIEPTIIADISEGTRLVDEEQFGPVLPVMSFANIDDVIQRANGTRFGLGASVWTDNIAKGAEVAKRLEAGVVWLNHHLGVSAEYPFGGMKESGIGRANGVMGLKANMEPRLVVLPGA